MSRQRIWLCCSWIIVILVGAVTFFLLRDQPFLHDAKGYVRAARSMSDEGLLNRWYLSDFRTYGYPLFLVGTFKFAAWLHLTSIGAVFVLQWTIFVGSTWLATRSLLRDRRARLVAFVFIAANPLVVVYTAHALTESLSLSCVLLSVAAIGRSTRSQSDLSTTAWLAGGALTSSFSMVVRPGDLFVPLCYGIAAVVVLIQQRFRSPVVLAAAGSLILASLVGPLVPQVVINHRNYDQVMPMPAVDLTDVQIRAGLQLVRYATNVSSDCGVATLMFMSPDKPSLNMTTIGALRYYTLDWPEGPGIAALHVFSSLDPRPFLPYQRDFGAGYERWLQAFTVAMLMVAGLALPRAMRRARSAGGGLRMDAVFLGLVTLFSIGVSAISAAEYRFGLIAVATASLLASLELTRIRRPTSRSGSVILIAYLFALLAWFTISDLVLATSTTWLECT